MTAFHPLNDRLDVFSAALAAPAEVNAATLMSRSLAQGVGIAIATDPATGVTTITNSSPATVGGSPNVVIPKVLATGTATAIIANFVPAMTALGDGAVFIIKLAYPIAGATTINPSALGIIALVDADGIALANGAGPAGADLLCVYDAMTTSARVLAGLTSGGGSVAQPMYRGTFSSTCSTDGVPVAIGSQIAAINGLVDSVWAGGQLTVGPTDAGLWFFGMNAAQTGMPSYSSYNDIHADVQVFATDGVTLVDSWYGYAGPGVNSSGTPNSTATPTVAFMTRVSAGQIIHFTVAKVNGAANVIFGALNLARVSA